MKILKFKGKMQIKDKILISILILLIVASTAITFVYATNEEARNWININILKKEVTEEDVATIEIDSDKVQYFYSYNKYITILCNGKLDIYNNYASKVHELEIGIGNPIFQSNSSSLLIAEKGRTENLPSIRTEKYNGKIR